MEKKYNLIHQFRLETSVDVDGERVRVSFTGGSKYNKESLRNGSLTTGDVKLQKALEEDAAYGKQWILAEEYHETTEPQEEPANDEPINDDPIEAHTVTPDDPDVTIAEDVNNYTEAKAYLKARFPETAPKGVVSKETVRDFARDNNISFPNWTE